MSEGNELGPHEHVHVANVDIQGHTRTKESFFAAEFDGIEKCQNVETLYTHLGEVSSRLQRSGIFEGLETNIRVLNDEQRTTAAGERIHNIAIDVNVKEVGIPFLKMESYVRAGSGGASSSSGSGSSSFAPKGDIGGQLQGALRNPLGYGEVAKLSVGRSTTGGREFILDLTVPNVIILPKPSWYLGHSIAPTNRYSHNQPTTTPTTSHEPYELYVGAKKIEENSSYFVSFRQVTHSLLGELSSRTGAHKLSAELAVRDEIPTVYERQANPDGSGASGSASEGLLSLVNSSAKSSLKYVFTHDSRDTPASPTQGTFLQSTVELAAPPYGWRMYDGSARYVRTEVVGQWHAPVVPACVQAWRWTRRQLGLTTSPSTPAQLHWGSGTGPHGLGSDVGSVKGVEKKGLVMSIVGNVGVLWPLSVSKWNDTSSSSSSGRGSSVGTDEAFRAYLTDRLVVLRCHFIITHHHSSPLIITHHHSSPLIITHHH